MTIRQATQADVPALCAMGRKFIAYSPYASMADVSDDELATAIDNVVAACTVFISVRDGAVVGTLVASESRLWFAPSVLLAVEMAWWVDEGYRGTRVPIELIRAFEAWAKDIGAKAVVMSDLVIDGKAPVGAMLGRMGYVMSERSHMKEIN